MFSGVFGLSIVRGVAVSRGSVVMGVAVSRGSIVRGVAVSRGSIVRGVAVSRGSIVRGVAGSQRENRVLISRGMCILTQEQEEVGQREGSGTSDC